MRLEQLDLNLLLVLEALWHERSVSKAARRLGVAQPSLSGALARLRRHLDDDLFVRSGGAMAPTALATRLAPGVLAALEQVRGTLSSTDRFLPAEATGSFTIASSDYTSFVLLPRIVSAITRTAPGVTLRVIGYDKGNVARLIEAGEADLALGVFTDLPPQIVVTRLYSEHFVGVCRQQHPALEQGRLSLDAYLAAHHALVSLRGDKVGEVDKALEARGLSRTIRLVVPHMMSLAGSIAATDLLSAIAARAAARFRSEGLEIFELPVPLPRWHVQMIWNSGRRREHAHGWLRASVRAAAQE
jgi:DNA-binding transcriptional LysR family regulator